MRHASIQVVGGPRRPWFWQLSVLVCWRQRWQATKALKSNVDLEVLLLGLEACGPGSLSLKSGPEELLKMYSLRTDSAECQYLLLMLLEKFY